MWSVTVGPLQPNVYAYSFWIDGIRAPDLASPAVKPEPQPVSSMFEVPADRRQNFNFDPAVPHGTVRLHDYESKSLGKLRRMRVYTPPGYDQSPRARYPGLSMGGGQSLTIGLTHLERFAWLDGMRASVANRELAFAELIKDPKAANQQLKLLWFSCGKSDGLLQPNEQIDETLTGHGVWHTFVRLEGGHEWTVWRRGLEEFLPLVFIERK
jgi:enterochelin esterase-like enzyme